MTRTEFEERITTQKPTTAEYVEIEYVYNFHPSIKTKEDIARIWDIGGMRLIKDMKPTAEEAEELECDIADAQRRLAQLQEQYRCLRTGEKYEI